MIGNGRNLSSYLNLCTLGVQLENIEGILDLFAVDNSISVFVDVVEEFVEVALLAEIALDLLFEQDLLELFITQPIHYCTDETVVWVDLGVDLLQLCLDEQHVRLAIHGREDGLHSIWTDEVGGGPVHLPAYLCLWPEGVGLAQVLLERLVHLGAHVGQHESEVLVDMVVER